VVVELYQRASQPNVIRRLSITDPFTEALDDGNFEAGRELRDRTRWDAIVNEETATWAGFLVDLGEQQSFVSIHLQCGAIAGGQVIGVGADVVVLSHAGDTIAIASDAIGCVEPSDIRVTANGERVGADATLASTMRRAADEKADAIITLRGSASVVRGRIHSCGVDLCTVMTTMTPRRYVHVPVSAIAMFWTTV
jgi:hypothetical protein